MKDLRSVHPSHVTQLPPLLLFCDWHCNSYLPSFLVIQLRHSSYSTPLVFHRFSIKDPRTINNSIVLVSPQNVFVRVWDQIGSDTVSPAKFHVLRSALRGKWL